VSFVQALFLLGALAVVGPIVAHVLAKPKYRRVPFTMLRFLRAGQIESQSRRRLRDLLLLALRCAIIALLAALFAGPRLLASPESETARTVHFLGLDNSMSMAYGDYAGQMRSAAAEYVRAADEDAVFNLHALASGEAAVDLDKTQTLAWIEQIEIVPLPAALDEFHAAVSKIKPNDERWREVGVFIASDFTPKFAGQFETLDAAAQVDSVRYAAVAGNEATHNVAVVNAHVHGLVDETLRMNVTAVNYSDHAKEIRFAASVDGVEVASQVASLSQSQRKTVALEIPIPTGRDDRRSLPVRLTAPVNDKLAEDDTFYLAVGLPERTSSNILILAADEREGFLLEVALETLSMMAPYETLAVRTVTYDGFFASALDNLDVLLATSAPAGLETYASQLEAFVERGGRLIIFLSARQNSDALSGLADSGLLPAVPGKLRNGRVYLASRPAGGTQGDALSPDGAALRTLANYDLRQFFFSGFYELEPHPESVCLWEYENDTGFLYLLRLGNGFATLVNTSADDSLGALMKSPAAVAFCTYLLGQREQLKEFAFVCGDQATLPASQFELEHVARQPEVYIETPAGNRLKAAVAEGRLAMETPAELGFLRTVATPVRYAGLNLAEGETDMAAPPADLVGSLMAKAFQSDTTTTVAAASMMDNADYRHLWKYVAWGLIMLLLIEAFAANRMKR